MFAFSIKLIPSPARRVMSRGFGLIEMMIVIAIVAVMAAIALPSYRQVIKSNRVTTDTNDLVTAFNLARNEAISRGRPVTVCASTDGASCAAAAGWASGWIVFTDYGTIGSVNADKGDTVLRVWPAWTTQDTVVSDSRFVSFGRDGAATFQGAAATSATYTIAPPNCVSGDARAVTVALLGRPSSTSSSDAAVSCT